MCAKALAIALFSLVALGGWDTARADWETTRKAVIDPLNSALHRHLPTFLKNRDLEAVLALYTTDVGTGLTWDGAHTVYTGREEEMWRWAGPTGSESIR